MDCGDDHILDETLCECHCPNVSICKANNRYFSQETCQCEETDCILDCPRRFELDADSCSCVCNKSCDNPKKPYLDDTKCKCVKNDPNA